MIRIKILEEIKVILHKTWISEGQEMQLGLFPFSMILKMHLKLGIKEVKLKFAVEAMSMPLHQATKVSGD